MSILVLRTRRFRDVRHIQDGLDRPVVDCNRGVLLLMGSNPCGGQSPTALSRDGIERREPRYSNSKA